MSFLNRRPPIKYTPPIDKQPGVEYSKDKWDGNDDQYATNYSPWLRSVLKEQKTGVLNYYDSKGVDGGDWKEKMANGVEYFKNNPQVQKLSQQVEDKVKTYGDRVVGAVADSMDGVLNQADQIMDSVLPPGQRPTGGAEYSLVDTVVLVFIILAIIMLVYVMLAETGVLAKLKSGVHSVMTDDCKDCNKKRYR
jgi:hypothetical protein